MAFYEYIAPPQWKTLNALVGFGVNGLRTTDALSSQTFAIGFPDSNWTLAFHDAEHLTWTVDHEALEEHYLAREVCDDLFLIEFEYASRQDRAIVVLIDRSTQIVTAVISTCVGDTHHVQQELLHGWLTGSDERGRHEPTTELVGHRVQYNYGPKAAYEHIYLNSSTFSWHCIAGAERGQADADFCRALKVRDRVYLFMWIERVVPCDGVAVIDWAQMRNNGRIFGWDSADRAYNSISMGARAVPLNVTSYVPVIS